VADDVSIFTFFITVHRYDDIVVKAFRCSI